MSNVTLLRGNFVGGHEQTQNPSLPLIRIVKGDQHRLGVCVWGGGGSLHVNSHRQTMTGSQTSDLLAEVLLVKVKVHLLLLKK